MRIIWSDFASKSLSSIYKYYKIEAGEKVADKLRKEIFEATKINPKKGDGTQLSIDF